MNLFFVVAVVVVVLFPVPSSVSFFSSSLHCTVHHIYAFPKPIICFGFNCLRCLCVRLYVHTYKCIRLVLLLKIAEKDPIGSTTRFQFLPFNPMHGWFCASSSTNILKIEEIIHCASCATWLLHFIYGQCLDFMFCALI